MCTLKVKICRHFAIKGKCDYGDACCFAHGPEELRMEGDAWTKPYREEIAALKEEIVNLRRKLEMSQRHTANLIHTAQFKSQELADLIAYLSSENGREMMITYENDQSEQRQVNAGKQLPK